VEADVPVADALRISGRSAGETNLRHEAMQLAEELESSQPEVPLVLSSVYRVLPQTVTYAVQFQANPKAAALILRELSWMYDQQTRNRLAWMSSLVEPVLIIMLGTIVGFYVVSLFMPFVLLIQNLTN
jgi:type IV pilus assembly protein PilC